MTMLGTGELCRAIIEDAEVARAFELDSDSARDFFSTLLLGGDAQASSLARSALSQIDIVAGGAARVRVVALTRPETAPTGFVAAAPVAGT